MLAGKVAAVTGAGSGLGRARADLEPAPRVTASQRFLIINADDFGRSLGINRGIVTHPRARHCHEREPDGAVAGGG
jgi:hypothetical protein